MDVVSACPLRVASNLWQPRPSAWTLTVVCRATFRLEPGESPLADVQEEPAEDDGYWNDDEARSLHAPSDLVPFKARADVLGGGTAGWPTGRAPEGHGAAGGVGGRASRPHGSENPRAKGRRLPWKSGVRVCEMQHALTC